MSTPTLPYQCYRRAPLFRSNPPPPSCMPSFPPTSPHVPFSPVKDHSYTNIHSFSPATAAPMSSPSSIRSHHDWQRWEFCLRWSWRTIDADSIWQLKTRRCNLSFIGGFSGYLLYVGLLGFASPACCFHLFDHSFNTRQQGILSESQPFGWWPGGGFWPLGLGCSLWFATQN